MKSLMTHVLGTVLASATAGAIPTATYAGHRGMDIDIDIASRHRHVDPPICEDRPVQVWVEPVYRTMTDRHWCEPVYRTMTERVWCPPVTRTVTERIWVPERHEDRRVTHYGAYGPRVTYERVCVPAHYEDRTHDVVIAPGHYDDVQHRELVSEGRWEIGERQELVCAGHYETRIERVEIERSHVDEHSLGRIALRLPFP